MQIYEEASGTTLKHTYDERWTVAGWKQSKDKALTLYYYFGLAIKGWRRFLKILNVYVGRREVVVKMV